jgi:phosphonate transport system substrate-binding protein
MTYAVGVSVSLAWVGLIVTVPAGAQSQAPAIGTVFEIKAGDTFSGIAGQVTGDPGLWRQLYDRRLSGLPNPHRVFAGSTLELAQAPGGKRYLRVVKEAQPAPAAAAVAVKAQQREIAANAQPVIAKAQPVIPAKAEPPATLTVGLLPNIGAEALLAQYEPMKRFLERQNPQKVRLVTSANFKEFFSAGTKGDFDLAVSAPHLARVMQLDGAMVPVAMFEPRIRALLVAPSEKALELPQDVRGKTVAFANPQSLVAMYAVRWLGEQGLQAGKDFQIKAPRDDMGVGRLMLSGEAVAGIMSNGEFRQIPREETARLKIVREIARIPNFVVLAHPRLGREYIDKIRGQLRGFIGDMEDGAAFAQATGVAAVVEADEGQLRELNAHVEQTRRAMGGAPR